MKLLKLDMSIVKDWRKVILASVVEEPPPSKEEMLEALENLRVKLHD